MTITHSLGLPRIGAQRELKTALEDYWAGRIDADALHATGRTLRARHWQLQADAGLDFVTVGDFAWYDHVLAWSTLLGAVPPRFAQNPAEPVALDTLFRMARGRAPTGAAVAACEMTKWFDTNYHYIVPELAPGQTYRLAREELFDHVEEARALGHAVKPVIPGPLTWLWLGKGDAYPGGAGDVGKLALLPALLPVYVEVLRRLAAAGTDWVQVDEPILALDLPRAWQDAYLRVYETLADAPVKLLVATYFEGLRDNLPVAACLPIAGLHLDLVRAPEQLEAAARALDGGKVLSAGVIDGRNVWRADLDALHGRLRPLHASMGERLWLAPSCSLLHVPLDLTLEADLDAELKGWLSFAVQKLDELDLLAQMLDAGTHRAADIESSEPLRRQRAACASRACSPRIHHDAVKRRLAHAQGLSRTRLPFAERSAIQQEVLGLPAYPTTTIGSFPQTPQIRATRRAWKAGTLGDAAYQQAIGQEIEAVIRFQEEAGLDVLVHGEPERNDMVEYFGELLAGFAFTRHGWVQSYGSRCVKPPIIFGDVARPAPMTVAWSTYAQSLTSRPVKGMLTGPVTLLQWSFVRDDQPRERTCRQLALALRDEVSDLERAGIRIIQIDEPAIREGLPLRGADRQEYLDWAVDCFRLATSGVAAATQIHTHMCYSEFNDIIESVAALDADVITIETSRSRMALLKAFEDFDYPNAIGPGVYDIHSPNVPEASAMVALLRQAARCLPAERLWVNPDCGLKTRAWPETAAALHGMVAAARELRGGN